MDLKTLEAYLETYEKPFQVMKKTWRGEFPFKAKLINGHEVEITSKRDAYLFTTFRKLKVRSLSNKHIEFSYRGKDLFFTFEPNDYVNLGEIFGDGVYDVNVNLRTVVDVGSGIGDSTTFFLLNGASHVIAVDIAVRRGKDNVEKNVSEGKVTWINKRCDLNFNLDVLSFKYTIPNGSVLKVDCKGCEYDFLLSTRTISRYKRIVVEYNDGKKPLVKYLRQSGFSVYTTGGRRVGLIYAFRRDVK